MDYEALLERIKNLDEKTLEDMSPEVMARLTDRFDESLVRNMLYIATTNYEQRKVIKIIKKKYKLWKKNTDILWGGMPQLESYPEFMEELQTDIECGLVITEKGTFQEDHATLKISLIPSNAVPVKAFQKGFQSVMQKDKGKTAVSNQKGLTDKSYIESLEAENARLRGELELKNKESIEGQDSKQPDSPSSEITKLKARNKELQEALNTEKEKNASLEEKMSELQGPVENLTASQNVRLEFALQLLRAAGMEDKMLERQTRKKATVARLMMLLTDIRSNNARGIPEHSCEKYLSDRSYLTKDNKELIIQINNLCVELGINVTLNL